MTIMLTRYSPSNDPGDDRVVLRVLVTWRGTVEEALREPLTCHVQRDPETRAWTLFCSIPRGKKLQRHILHVDAAGTGDSSWKLVRLGPHTWDVSPSVHIPGQLHAFITLTNVPEPAPWPAVAEDGCASREPKP